MQLWPSDYFKMPHSPRTFLFITSLVLANNASLANKIDEAEVHYIPLAPPLDRAKAQISSMAWCGDSLLLLPERPWFEIAEDDPDPKEPIATFIYQLTRTQIDNYLLGKHFSEKQVKPLIASKITLEENGIRNIVQSFDGYEAIVCSGNDIWLSIETEIKEHIFETNIVGASLSGKADKQKIRIDPSSLHRIKSQSGIDNFSDEALLFEGDYLISIHEANKTSREASSFATRINSITNERTRLPFPAISFRITDATDLDDNGYFWGINYAWSGESQWFTQVDDLAKTYGMGESHKLEKTVERLIQFRLNDKEIQRVEKAPIQLKLTQEDGRNWEGIVRYEDKGLLLITDQYPRTLLGYVKFN